MTLDEIREVLTRTADVRMPRFTPDMGGRQKVELLEDYLNLTAVARGELEQARLWAHMALRELLEQWDAIEGWMIHLPSGRHTKDDVIAAKREIRPDVHDALKECKWLVERLGEQIDRLGSRMGDDQVASRIYTLITSG